ncbi:MAG TPA: hypothetical protein VFN35_22380 [Ktedonobacteraceae bacterium]|nr:hypothetical protein [Ktedonobacteraceae bacterium]
MAERATLQIRLSQGKPMLLVLTDQPALVLQDTLELDQGLEQADETLAEVMSSHPLIGRLLRFLVMPRIEEAERFVERLKSGLPLSEVEQIELDDSGFSIQWKGHGHPRIHLEPDGFDRVAADTFAQQVEAARNQEGCYS